MVIPYGSIIGYDPDDDLRKEYTVTESWIVLVSRKGNRYKPVRIWSVMIRYISKIRNSYYLPLTTALLGAFAIVVAVTTGGLVGIEVGINTGTKKNLTEKKSNVFDVVHELRVKFATDHGVADPAALVAAVRHSPMANLLISVAIEESRGDPSAVGSSGEQGAWQVMASDWGAVPKDIQGQAGQAERIIRSLLIHTNGNKKRALARYNGGTSPAVRSYRYAERILKRAGHLQVAVNYLLPNYRKFRVVLIDPPGNSRRL
ncbi:MAG: hypothetical protein PVSMB11_11800 [Desulfuromonadaceae bacterium]